MSGVGVRIRLCHSILLAGGVGSGLLHRGSGEFHLTPRTIVWLAQFGVSLRSPYAVDAQQ